MALDVLEKYQVEYLVEQLKKIYPNELDDFVIEQLKNKLIDSGKDLSSLTKELYELGRGDKMKLQSFLVQYEIGSNTSKTVDMNSKKEEIAPYQSSKVDYDSNNEISNKLSSGISTSKVLLPDNEQYKAEEVINITEEEELNKIVLATTNMSNQEVAIYLRNLGKNPQQIMMIMLKLEEKKAQIQQPELTLEKPKQKVLTNSNSRGRMAGFIDALTLAFFVGAVSGMAFFILIKLLIQAMN